MLCITDSLSFSILKKLEGIMRDLLGQECSLSSVAGTKCIGALCEDGMLDLKGLMTSLPLHDSLCLAVGF